MKRMKEAKWTGFGFLMTHILTRIVMTSFVYYNDILLRYSLEAVHQGFFTSQFELKILSDEHCLSSRLINFLGLNDQDDRKSLK